MLFPCPPLAPQSESTTHDEEEEEEAKSKKLRQEEKKSLDKVNALGTKTVTEEEEVRIEK